jgi:hypothetical protein
VQHQESSGSGPTGEVQPTRTSCCHRTSRDFVCLRFVCFSVLFRPRFKIL